MTTAELRRIICIKRISKIGELLCLDYTKEGEAEPETLFMKPGILKKELIAISSIEESDNISEYIVSQWDALNLVIRHELEMAIEKEDSMLNIDTLINKINNQNY